MAEIRVPTLGESVSEATIGKWFKKAGDAVAVDEPLVELETDKVTIEVPAPAAGVLAEVAVKDGDDRADRRRGRRTRTARAPQGRRRAEVQIARHAARAVGAQDRGRNRRRS